MSLSIEEKKKFVQDFGMNDKDTGSTAVQISLLTKKIDDLTEHLKVNRKDFASKRGLLVMVSRRRRLLSYYENKSVVKYQELLKRLGLKK